jgi:hypothetical protein
MNNDNTVLMEGVRIIFRNFDGKEGPYNKPGSRNFGVVLPSTELADQMTADGWNVKWLEPRPEYEDEIERVPWLPVEVAYDRGRPPRIVLITSRGRTNIGEELVEELNWVSTTNIDMIVRPHTWSRNGRGGVKAYLQSMYVTVEEDALELKYGDVPLQ